MNHYVNNAKKILSFKFEQSEFDEFKKNIYVCAGSNQQQQLKNAAQQNRSRIIGNNLFIRGSLEFNNICKNNCSFCGMSNNNKTLKRYSLSLDEIKKSIDYLTTVNVKQLHLVSGESTGNNKLICEAINYARSKNLSVTLVLGERNEKDYREFFDAGARRYILKFETSNANIYNKYKGKKSLITRIAHLLLLRDIGYKIGTGNIVGLPGTDTQDLFFDLKLIKAIEPDMGSCSVFSPNEESDLSSYPAGNINIALNYLAIMRCVLLKTPIITCSSSFGLLNQCNALKFGANLVSCHITPDKYVDLFSMYTAKTRLKTEYEKIIELATVEHLNIKEYD